MQKYFFLIITVFAILTSDLHGQKITIDRNKTDCTEWFEDVGFGMLITWSVDVQLSGLSSFDLPGSSADFQEMYFNELPKTFNPQEFDPVAWAKSAKLAGVQYMVFTAKQPNGFCMWDTHTSEFNVMNSAIGKDVLKLTLDAFRKQGIAVGISFSPNDYYILYKQGILSSGQSEASKPTNNSALWETDQKQLQELLNNYGKIDILSIEEKADWANPLVANYAWDLDPNLLITRGGMETYAYNLPEKSSPGPWEVTVTMGYNRQYTSEENYKDTGMLIKLLAETRAKGGNFLLNIGPDASGKISHPQATRLQEIGLWMMSNREAIINVKPWFIPKEQDIWFTSSKNDRFVYAFVNAPYWNQRENKAFFIGAVKGTRDVKITLLSQKSEESTSSETGMPNPYFSNTEYGIFINAVNTGKSKQRGNNPVVFKLEGVSFRDNFGK